MGGWSGEVDSEEAERSALMVMDSDDAADVAMLQIPNTTFQTRPQDVTVREPDDDDDRHAYSQSGG